MPTLTWRDFMPHTPDIGASAQQGIRNAGDLFNRAVDNATAGAQGLQQLEIDRKATETKAADRYVLERMLGVTDPVEYRKMLADGSLVGPAAGKVSQDMLVKAHAREGFLHEQGRTRTREEELKAAEAIWDLAAPVAVDDPALAQKIIGTMKFSNAEDQAAFAKRASDLLKDPRASQAKKDEAIDIASAGHLDMIRNRFGNDPDAQAEYFAQISGDPRIKERVQNELRKSDPAIAAAISGPSPTGGVNEAFGDPGGNTPIYGIENALGRRWGDAAARAADRKAPPPPGSAAWQAANPGRTANQAELALWNQTHMLPITAAMGVGDGRGTTATGFAQIVNKTRLDVIKNHGKELFGTTDPTAIPVTVENEEKIARKVYETQKSSAWEVFKGYKGLQPKAFEGKSFEEVAPLIYWMDGNVRPQNFKREAEQIQQVLERRERGLTEGARVVINARASGSFGLNEAADELLKRLGKGGEEAGSPWRGDVTKFIDETRRRTGNELSYAETVGLILNSVREDTDLLGFGSVADLRADLALDEGRLESAAADMKNARKEVEGFEKKKKELEKVVALRAKYDLAEQETQRQIRAAKNNAEAGSAAIKAARRTQRISEELARAMERVSAEPEPDPSDDPKALEVATRDRLSGAVDALETKRRNDPVLTPAVRGILQDARPADESDEDRRKRIDAMLQYGG